MATDRPFDVWDRSNAARRALVGELDYRALRAPRVERETPRAVETPTPAVTRETIAPGMRYVNGEWLYSAAWL
jgi:hypothetical protein